MSNKRKTNKITITKAEAETWLDHKCKELNLDSYEELEDYADNTEDFKLRSEINRYLLVILPSPK